ncbi:hypothetical protein HanPI659440_Chr02g0089481 [Helianthus annuus]|nr:hypothetical protein HanPI659440_Chr02g0089481 [Helianthus annuus]
MHALQKLIPDSYKKPNACAFNTTQFDNILKKLKVERTVTKKQIRTRTAVKQLSSLHVLKEDTRDWREENLSTHIPPRIMKKFLLYKFGY